jgi:hypothetical protein
MNDFLRINNMNFDVREQFLVKYSAFTRYRREKWEKMGQSISYRETSRKPLGENYCASFSFVLVRLIKMSLWSMVYR